jgi:anti-sigma B factor antagonist
VPDSSFPVTRSDGLAVLTTPDEIDISNAGLLREALLAAAADRQPVVIVDMRATEFCDSTGLSVLVRALKQVGPSGHPSPTWPAAEQPGPAVRARRLLRYRG